MTDRSDTDVTRDGLLGGRPGRDAMTGVAAGRGRSRRWGRRRSGETPQVPRATFESYYGRPILNPPTWLARDIAGYLFLGGLAGASSLLAEGARITDRPQLGRSAKLASIGAAGLSLAALVHDLGRPARFLNMLRVAKPTSPMSVGSWLLSGYAPLAGVAAASDLTGKLPRIGAAATSGAAVLGPAVAAYTAVLISDTAVPAWHDGHRELPYVFVGSAATAAGGFGLLTAPVEQAAPARVLAGLGVGIELTAYELMQRRIGIVSEAFSTGRPSRYLRAAKALSVAGLLAAVVGRRNRLAQAFGGAALVGASAATRFGIFHAGVESARDPMYTVVPQRKRLDAEAAPEGHA